MPLTLKDIEEKREKIIELCEKKGFIDGVDVTLEICLFEYGLLRRRADGLTIFSLWYDNNNLLYDIATISPDNISKVIEEMRPGFFDYIGQDREYYIDIFKRAVKENKDLSSFIQDICQYDNRLVVLTYTMNDDSLLKFLENN